MPASATEIALDFSLGGNAGSAMVSGWSTPEREETWAIGVESRLSLPTPVVPATYVLVLKLRAQPLSGKPEGQRLGVSVNGIAVDEFLIGERATRACLLPWDILRGAAAVSIVFSTPDATKPADVGNGDDTRSLAFAFFSVRLYSSMHEEWAGGGVSGPEPMSVSMADIAAVDRLAHDKLMLGFESLGQNCEFGLVQRQCLAEPLGLLRFSSTPLPKLLAALDCGFAGLGSPGTVVAELAANGREYMVRDTVFGFLYHAWVKAGEATADEVRRREERRVPFLIRKLLEELRDSTKIFVFKGMGPLRDEAVFPLAAALRRYGPNTLLFVNVADSPERVGTVEARAPGFLVGHVGRFAPSEDAHDFELGDWLRVCREAYRLKLASPRGS